MPGGPDRFYVHCYTKRRCLGTFSRLARSLATIYIFERVRIFFTLVPFYATGNFLKFPVIQKNLQRASLKAFLLNFANYV